MRPLSPALRPRVRAVHRAAAYAAPTMVAAFLAATLVSEASGDFALVAAVKRGILTAIPGLVLAMAVAGATGARLASGSKAPIVRGKRRRTALVAANGFLVLVPAAFVLDRLAAAGAPTPEFVAVQAVEVVAGSLNLALMALNIRDGRRLAPRSAKKAKADERPGVASP